MLPKTMTHQIDNISADTLLLSFITPPGSQSMHNKPTCAHIQIKNVKNTQSNLKTTVHKNCLNGHKTKLQITTRVYKRLP